MPNIWFLNRWTSITYCYLQHGQHHRHWRTGYPWPKSPGRDSLLSQILFPLICLVFSGNCNQKPNLRINFLERKLFRPDRYFNTVLFSFSFKILLAESLIDKAIEVRFIGGVYGNQRPTEFLCLLLKLLQIQPEKEILVEYLRAEEFKCGLFPL